VVLVVPVVPEPQEAKLEVSEPYLVDLVRAVRTARLRTQTLQLAQQHRLPQAL
jgi:hypothetical protein